MRLDDDLIELAQQLARLDPKRPRQVALRRAVSTAYYALFHALASCCADTLVTYSKPYEVYSPIYRALDHAKARKVLKELSRHAQGVFALIDQAFIELQEQRHLADYDPEPRLGKNETLALIDQARTAIGLIRVLSADDRLKLSTQLIGRAR